MIGEDFIHREDSMNIKRWLTALCCAAAVAVFVAPGARADEYTKQTFLTFSGPVQVPGATLPAGTYMFKLADPDSGRRAIQIWDKDGGNLITTLLTIPNEGMEAADEPVVLFSERAVGDPQAVKAWFYPGDRIGQEFIYPKDQAMKIARDAQTSVLSYNDETNLNNDTTTMRGAKVGRIDATGQVADLDNDAPAAATASTVDNTSTASTADRTAAASTATASTADQAAAGSSANRSGVAAADARAANPDSQNRENVTGTTASAGNQAATDNQANRSGAPAPAAQATTGSTAPDSTTATTASASGSTATAGRSDAAEPSAVGTSGQAGATNAQATGTSADRAAGTAGSRQELPRTASPLTAIELLAGLSLLGSLSVRQVRRRYAMSRH
jgi:hypothetical protein